MAEFVKGVFVKYPAEFRSKLKPVELFLGKGKFDAASEYLENIRKEYQKFHLVSYYMGICLVNQGFTHEAVQELETVKGSNQLSPVQLIQSRMLLGLIYTEIGDFAQAERNFKSALEINDQSSMNYSALGYVYYLMKRYDIAIQNFKKAIALDPNNAGAYNNLGYTYAEIGINLSEAVQTCKTAIRLNPMSAAYYDSLGWAYFSGQNYAESVNALQKALTLDSANQTIRKHINEAIRKRDHGK